MNQEKHEILLKVIDRWVVDIETGIVKTRFGNVENTIHGYRRITTSFDGKNYSFRLHQVIVVKAGLNPVGMTINHINGVKTDNRISNLEIITSKENTLHAIKTGLRKPNNAIPPEKFDAIRKEVTEGKMSQRAIAQKYQVGVGTVNEIKTGKRRRNIL
jgi:DNA-binding transcriptional regulator YiaG